MEVKRKKKLQRSSSKNPAIMTVMAKITKIIRQKITTQVLFLLLKLTLMIVNKMKLWVN
jgi:hypothetical protein